jgi:hypothetical protein
LKRWLRGGVHTGHFFHHIAANFFPDVEGPPLMP